MEIIERESGALELIMPDLHRGEALVLAQKRLGARFGSMELRGNAWHAHTPTGAYDWCCADDCDNKPSHRIITEIDLRYDEQIIPSVFVDLYCTEHVSGARSTLERFSEEILVDEAL